MRLRSSYGRGAASWLWGNYLDLHTLKQLIQTAPWFSNLGDSSLHESGVVAVTSEQWRDYGGIATASEFGLRHDASILDSSPLKRFEWLPSTIGQEDLVHGHVLSEKAGKEGKASDYKAVRMEVFKLAQVSLRGASQHPLLVIGPTNLTESARATS